MEAVVDQYSVDKNIFEIQIKQLRNDNDQVLNQIMSQEIVHTVANSVDILDVKKSYVNNCNKCLELETEIFKKKDFIEKEAYDKLVKSYPNLEKHCISLELVKRFFKGKILVFANAALQNELRKLKGKNVVNTAVSKPNATIAPGMFKLDIEPISPRLKNNRDAHEVYIEKTIKYTDTLCGFVERAKTQYPSKALLKYACMFTKHVQELLVYASQTCLNSPKPSEKSVAVTLINKDKRVRSTEPVTSSNNIPKKTDSFKTKDSNKPFNALVKHSVRNAKFESICAICNKCLFDVNHDMCLIDFVNDVNVRSKSKSKRNKMRKAWKPTGKVFTDVGYKWKPTGIFFTIGSNATDAPSSSSLVNDRLSRSSSAYALGKIKKSSHQPKAKDTNQEKLYLLHMDLCSPMRVESINGKKYILVIVDDYSRFTWVKFLRSKDEAPNAIIKCIKNIQVRLKATVYNVITDNGTEFVNQTLRDFYENVDITHQTSVARTPQQNGVVERRN
ncbi:retrovirus-related pol polyprotein from transposon TNT 1-94 [Tanacetum coccineum]